MRETRRIAFLAHRAHQVPVPLVNAFEFKPKGRAQWLQRLAWRFLNWRRAMDQAYELKTEVTTHTIDADRFVDRLLKQGSALLEGFGKEGQRLIIGSEDYAELMSCPEVRLEHFSFDAELGVGRRFLGLKVEVVPWIRGAVVLP